MHARKYSPLLFSPDVEQHSWANLPNSKCAELRQSPINIETNDVTDGDTALTLIGYDDPLDGSYFTLENNGHTIQLTIEDDHLDSEAIPRAQVNNGNSYRFKQLHFHWHQNDSKGSEHAINGRQSALEVSANVHLRQRVAPEKYREQERRRGEKRHIFHTSR